MKVNVADIKLETGTHKTVPVKIAIESVEAVGETISFDRPLEGQAEIWNVGDRLLVRAEVSGEATLHCSRCLTPFSYPLDVSFEEEFMEGAPGDQVDDEEVEVEQRTVTYYSGDEIDLSEPLRENALLELPMKPLCSKKCKGLCPTCGTNLNEGACTCVEEAQVVDPRLASLKDLLRKPDSKS
ncbi:MAG TPA: DUF177 domain-containing protein [Symbiobacteriaceae bacterium]|nr:DUF177 domain-containing protein [Symbiobacteriaceae bacterium]